MRRAARLRFYGNKVEAVRNGLQAAYPQELPGDAHEIEPLFPVNGVFRQTVFGAIGIMRNNLRNDARFHFNERDCVAIVTDYVDLAFASWKHVISGDENVTSAP